MEPSITFLNLTIENAYMFKGKYQLDLKNIGLAQLIGINKDAKSVNGTYTSSNGSGKTTIVKCFLRAWFGFRKACPHEIMSSTFYGSKEGSNFLLESSCLRYGHVYTVREVHKHRDYEHDGVTFYIDEKQVGNKNKEESYREEFLKKAIGMSYEEFTSTSVITQNSSNCLINGTAQQCTEFISQMFGLGKFDDIYNEEKEKYDAVNAKIAELYPKSIKLKTLESQLASLGDESIEDLKGSITTYSNKLDKWKKYKSELSEYNNTLIRKQEHLSQEADKLEKLDSMSSSPLMVTMKCNNDSIDKLEKHIADLTSKREKIKNIIDMSNSDLSVKIKNAKKLCNDLKYKKYLGISVVDLNHKLNTFCKNRESLFNEVSLLMKDEGKREQGKKLLEDLARVSDNTNIQLKVSEECYNNEVANNAKYKEDLKKLSKSISSISTLLRIKSRFDENLAYCPTCGSKVDRNIIKKEIKELENSRFELTKKSINLSRLETNSDALLACYTFYRENPNIDLSNDTFNKKSSELSELDREILNIRTLIPNLELVSSSDSNLIDIDVNEYNKKIDIVNEEILLENEKLNLLKRYSILAKEYSSATNSDVYKLLTDVNNEIDKTESDIKSVTCKIDDITESLIAAKDSIGIKTEITNRIQELKQDLSGLENLERDARVIKELCNAYGKSGLKLQKVSSIIKEIKNRLPRWLNLTMSDRNFRVDVKNEDKSIKLECVKTVSVEKKGKPIDVEIRYAVGSASGGEQTRILFALLMTLLDIIPEDKKTNLIMIDELERGLDPVNRYLVSEMFLPELRKIRPSILLITHSLSVDEDLVDRKIIVTRNNNSAMLEQINCR